MSYFRAISWSFLPPHLTSAFSEVSRLEGRLCAGRSFAYPRFPQRSHDSWGPFWMLFRRSRRYTSGRSGRSWCPGTSRHCRSPYAYWTLFRCTGSLNKCCIADSWEAYSGRSLVCLCLGLASPVVPGRSSWGSTSLRPFFLPFIIVKLL